MLDAYLDARSSVAVAHFDILDLSRMMRFRPPIADEWKKEMQMAVDVARRKPRGLERVRRGSLYRPHPSGHDNHRQG
jgi:hypothetical protein